MTNKAYIKDFNSFINEAISNIKTADQLKAYIKKEMEKLEKEDFNWEGWGDTITREPIEYMVIDGAQGKVFSEDLYIEDEDLQSAIIDIWKTALGFIKGWTTTELDKLDGDWALDAFQDYP